MNRKSHFVVFARKIQKTLSNIAFYFEKPFVNRIDFDESSIRSIFVLALPRSGSTLTYQCLCHSFEINYLSNIWHLFYKAPLTGGCLSNYLTRSYKSDFSSDFGFTKGLSGPAEGYQFWKYWLDSELTDQTEGNKLDGNQLEKLVHLKKSLSFNSSNCYPFSSTYLGHILLPEKLKKAFPHSIFIRLKRDKVLNALSILGAMRKNNLYWFSVKPKECDDLISPSEHKRVANQVYWLNKRLDEFASNNDVLEIDFEDLCLSPEIEMLKVLDYCRDRDIYLKSKYQLPREFNSKRSIINQEDAIRIRDEFSMLEEKYGK